MEQYIKKSALVAEINKRIMDAPINNIGHQRVLAYNDVKDILDTLEVEEVNLEKEAELIANSIMIPVQANLYHTNIYNFEKRCFKHSDLKEAAKKGFELGLKAQKGE